MRKVKVHITLSPGDLDLANELQKRYEFESRSELIRNLIRAAKMTQQKVKRGGKKV